MHISQKHLLAKLDGTLENGFTFYDGYKSETTMGFTQSAWKDDMCIHVLWFKNNSKSSIQINMSMLSQC